MILKSWELKLFSVCGVMTEASGVVSLNPQCRLCAVGVEHWSECRPKRVAENTVYKIQHGILQCISLVIHIFLDTYAPYLLCLWFTQGTKFMPIPVTTWSKEWVYGRSFAANVGSPVAWMSVSCECCVLQLLKHFSLLGILDT